MSLSETVEKVLIAGDLTALSAEDRVEYYKKVGQSLGLNMLTRPFDYILFYEPGGGKKLSLYANKSCAEQLRKIHGVSVIEHRQSIEGDYCHAEVKVQDRTGRTDFAIGSVPLFKYKDEGRGKVRVDLDHTERCNATMKASTKAKRRATLSICGLAFLDESELDGLEVIGGVTPSGRMYMLPEQAESTSGSHEAAQEVAKSKLEKAKAGESIIQPKEPVQEAPKAILGTVEIDWTDEASPIVRGDIGNLLELIQKHCKAEWRSDWWHVQPKDGETIREMCRQFNYKIIEVVPKAPSAKAERTRKETQVTRPEAVAPNKPNLSQATASEPAVIAATIQHFTEKMTKGSAKRPSQPYLNVLLKTEHGDRWYSVFDRELFEYLSKGKGKQGEFFVSQSGDFWNLTGIKVLAGRQFEDGKVPVTSVHREPGSLFK